MRLNFFPEKIEQEPEQSCDNWEVKDKPVTGECCFAMCIKFRGVRRPIVS